MWKLSYSYCFYCDVHDLEKKTTQKQQHTMEHLRAKRAVLFKRNINIKLLTVKKKSSSYTSPKRTPICKRVQGAYQHGLLYHSVVLSAMICKRMFSRVKEIHIFIPLILWKVYHNWFNIKDAWILFSTTELSYESRAMKDHSC